MQQYAIMLIVEKIAVNSHSKKYPFNSIQMIKINQIEQFNQFNNDSYFFSVCICRFAKIWDSPVKRNTLD